MKRLYNIIEVANVHAGHEDYMFKLMDEFKGISGVDGIKFQPFKYDKIALEDFSWYEVYKELFFSQDQWKSFIYNAYRHWDIWIDTFDDYSFEVAKNNFDKVFGFKFQASTLYNKNLVKLFSQLDLSKKKVILNISGLEMEYIKEVVSNFQTKLNSEEIILQIGFQSYPTQLIDSGLVKIKEIQTHFKNNISFADHIDPTDEDAIWLPVVAHLSGATYIEKHICLSGEKPQYDFYSSMNKDQYVRFLKIAEKYSATLQQPFVNENEAKYLSGSIQIPVLKNKMSKGHIPNLETNFEFKRSNQEGLRAHEIEKLVQSFHLLANDMNEKQALQATDFKKAKIATIIACRLKSTRLPKKALLKIGDITSVEMCIKNCLRFKNINHTILATSVDPEDKSLENYKYSSTVIFHQGDRDDVIQRYIDIIDKLNIDVFVRVTADMPYVFNEIVEILLKSHFENDADFTRAVDAAVGTNVEIISTKALKYIKGFFPNSNYSEYMSWYFVNNPKYLKLNFVDLPHEYIRNYRLTLDHQEDLDLFNKIDEHFTETKLQYTLTNLFSYLDNNPAVANLNSHITLKYRTDQTLIETLNKMTKIPKL